MKTLLIGLVSFLIWSSASTYWYICKVKNLCIESGSEISYAEKPVEADAPTETATSTQFIIHHDLNEADFKKTAELVNYVGYLKSILEENPEATVIVDGLADSQGSDTFNLELGKKRAEHVKAFLLTNSISADRIELLSEGESHPETTNSTAEGRAMNRRTIITLKNN